ncbi:MAG: GGDEF domain-containing protein [Spirochaetes bacterium]|nr:GGDEF domain-containing protein [Spirochaetota bacterium]
MAVHEAKVELLRKVDMFSQLREYELDNIAKYSEFIRLSKGDFIFSQGSAAEDMYVVSEGRVGIIEIESETDVQIAQIISGESFGELDFFGRINRSASAFTEEKTVLLRFPAKKYNTEEIFSKHPYISAQMLYRLLGIISERIWNVNNLLQEKSHWLHDLHKQLLCDKMTGLYNQTYLNEDFVNLLPNLDKSAALLMIKPDNFKIINDKYGHETGDHVLNLMAIFLQSELRENDIGVRYRGNEFAAILLNTDKKNSIERAKEISKTFKMIDLTKFKIPKNIKLKVSIGISLFPEDADNSKLLVETAHKRMFNAWEAGGNRIII